MHDAHAGGFELLRRPDARQQQHLRRIERAARKDDFARGERLHEPPILLVLNADAAMALEQQTRSQRMRLDAQIRPRHRRTQIARRSARAMPFVRIEVWRAEAFGLGRMKIIEVPDSRVSQRSRSARINEVIRHMTRSGERPGVPVISRRAAPVRLRAIEVRQAPPRNSSPQAGPPPLVVVTADARADTSSRSRMRSRRAPCRAARGCFADPRTARVRSCIPSRAGSLKVSRHASGIFMFRCLCSVPPASSSSTERAGLPRGAQRARSPPSPRRRRCNRDRSSLPVGECRCPQTSL